MEFFGGAPQEFIDAVQHSDVKDFEVYEENWPVIQMFLRAQTQWRMSFGGPTGLDYNALDVLFRRFPVEDQAFVWDGVQIMEAAALKAMT